eukprot:TRINITY_DN2115_c0_g1_i1.p1 TRINITY_DN2115_c0_g1~~TRINITY_DN2115_c0_g1_i1.p1  ORF type:complete len:1059 (-),score=246.27 TRINITY_DN2115_c0_g1_i1:588-3764(-)
MSGRDERVNRSLVEMQRASTGDDEDEGGTLVRRGQGSWKNPEAHAVHVNVRGPENEEEDERFRTIFINDDVFMQEVAQRFAKNVIRTTKYTWWSFLPKNLIEQFMRVANLYFLIIAILSSIKTISPLNPVTSILPLVFVLSVTAVKEAIEDYRRSVSDDEINGRLVTIIAPSGVEQEIRWRDLQVGSIVKVENKQLIPADMIALSTSEPQGLCYVETSNLDGETNLKIRQALPETFRLQPTEVRGFVRCEQPNNRLYVFEGFIHMKDGSKLSLSNKQILLRGCILRNTKCVYGVTIFTGHETKVMMNATETPSKRSGIERAMNRLIVAIFLFLFGIAVLCGIGSGIFSKTEAGDMWFLDTSSADAVFDDSNSAAVGILGFFSFIILFNTLIPISLYVTMEVIKVMHAYFVNNDVEMWHDETDTPAKARTSNLGEDLGQIQYIFSDKTGTLTRNVMEFLKCSIAGVSYGEGITEVQRAAAKRRGQVLEEKPPRHVEGAPAGFHFFDERLLSGKWRHEAQPDIIEQFFTLLAVCHTVVPERNKDDPDKIIYQAASPDEGALVIAASGLGFRFETRTPHSVTCMVDGQERVYDILNVLEFNSTRKRMSVICRTPEDKIILFSKGADTVIYERLIPAQPAAEITLKHLEAFAEDGLRTLTCAYAELDSNEYQQWAKVFHEASVALENREKKLDEAAELIEKNLILLGATAIEDKLQVGVPECIASLAEAGIKIWVLTGDKQETAINIGFACSLLTTEMELLVVNEPDSTGVRGALEDIIAKHGDGRTGKDLGLVIDGHSLQFALLDEVKLVLLEVGRMCRAVVCCRVSPLQKALVTKLVKENLGQVTLAIGDGANDVSMIQAAHIGVGISGQEGMQAVMAADYAIAQFRFLQRLLLVHGRYSYKRIAYVVNYFFYKNIAFTLTQFWFAFFSGFSGQRLYDDWYQSLFNVLWTSFPILVYGIFEQDLSPGFAMRFPGLYKSGQRSEFFNGKVFMKWIFLAIYTSLVLIFYPMWATHTTPAVRSNGQNIGLWSLGTIIFTCVIVVVNLRIAISTSCVGRTCLQR